MCVQKRTHVACPVVSQLIKITDFYEDESFKISKLEYDTISDISNIPKEAEIHFHEINNDTKELFDGRDIHSLCYNILEINSNSIRISLENYLAKKDDLIKILDRYFSWDSNYIKTVVV